MVGTRGVTRDRLEEHGTDLCPGVKGVGKGRLAGDYSFLAVELGWLVTIDALEG